MNKSELVDRIADASSVAKRDVENVVNAFFDTVKTAVRSGDQVSWPGFGAFKGNERAARTGRNPQTGEPVKIKASRGVKFSPSSALKEFLNQRSAKKSSPAKKAAGKRTTAKTATKSNKR